MKKRLIPCIFLKNGLIIRSEQFKIHQLIGNPLDELERFSDWAVDEIMYIDISRDSTYDLRRDDHKTKDTIKNKFDLVKEVAKHCFVPLGFGGGIRTIDEIRQILNNGADKVVLNTVLFTGKDILKDSIKIFGSQAIVACVDYKGAFVYHSAGKVKSNYKVVDWCKYLDKNGIGEIVLNSIDRDGMGTGYDIKTIAEVVKQTKVPVVALGGVGDYYDFVECFEQAKPSACAAGNIFHFKEHSYYHAKKTLADAGIDVRHEWESK